MNKYIYTTTVWRSRAGNLSHQMGTIHCICMPSAPYEVVTAQLASDWPGRWRVNYKNSLPSVTEACFPVNQQVPRLLLGNRHLITHLFVLLVFICVSKDARLNWGPFHCIAWLAHLYLVGKTPFKYIVWLQFPGTSGGGMCCLLLPTFRSGLLPLRACSSDLQTWERRVQELII